MQSSGVGEAVTKKLIDAVFVVSPLGSSLMDQVLMAMSSGGKAKPLFVDIKDAEALAQRSIGVEKVDIPSGFFGGSAPSPAEDITTIAVNHQLVAGLDLAEGTVDILTKRLLSLRRALAAQAPIAQYMSAAVTDKGSQFALHPGATSYYQDTEKSFMDRYGDWFYIAAMVLGGFGSAIATLVSSMQARTRRTAMAVVDELMTTQRRAHEANDVGVLKELAPVVERAALKALHQARDSRFGEAGLETVRLAIDEARLAIRRKRSELQSEPEPTPTTVTSFPHSGR